MAVLGRVLISSAERLDLPDFLSIDSYTQGDFKYLMGSFVGFDKPYILKGFDVINPTAAIGTQNITLTVADSVVYYPGSLAGPFFHGLEEGNAQAVPLIPELRKNATNYVYLTLTTVEAANDTRAFWDPDKEAGAGGEFTQDINTQTVLSVDVNVSVSTFPENTVPVCIVKVGPNFIEEIEDARDLMFRLGSGGLNPDPLNTYNFREDPTDEYARKEPNTVATNALDPNPFQGGDKNIKSLKEWMDVVMTKLLELGGTTYWYEDASTFSAINVFKDALSTSIKSKGLWISSDVTEGMITWSEDIVLQSVADKKDIIVRDGSKTMSNEQVMYIVQERGKTINTGGVDVEWFNLVDHVNGTLGAFENLNKGDWIKKSDDDDYRYLRVEEFYAGENKTGGVTAPGNALSVKLSEPYGGISESRQGVYVKGSYINSDVKVADRNDAALTEAGGDLYWLAMRSDKILDVSDITTTTLTIDITDHDGTTAKCTSVSHGLSDGQRIGISGTTNFDGVYQINVDTADVFYIDVTGGPFADEAAQSAHYATITTSARNTDDGYELESANHNFESDQTVIVENTSNYNGTYKCYVVGATSVTVPVTGAIANETAGNVKSVDIYVRTDFGPTKLNQGENKGIGETETTNIMSFIGMDNQAQTHPLYAVPSDYGTLENQVNYNSDSEDSLTARASKLTSMMADKAQDKNIKESSTGTTSYANLASGPDQILSFIPGGTFTAMQPGSPGNTVIGLGGSLTLAQNQVAMYTLDRNAATNIADLSGLTIYDIDSAPVDENSFVFAYRLSGTNIFLWNGLKVSGGITPVDTPYIQKVDYIDLVTETLPTGTSATIDGSSIVDGNTVLFTSLTVDPGVYSASGVGVSISWTKVACFQGGTDPLHGSNVNILGGTEYFDSTWRYDGSRWKPLDGDIIAKARTGFPDIAKEESLISFDDGTRTFTVEPLPAPLVEEYENISTGISGGGGINSYFANEITFGSDTTIDSVLMRVRNFGGYTGNWTLKIYADTGGGDPDETNVVATSDLLNASTVGSSFQDVTFTFSGAPVLTAGLKYFFGFDSSSEIGIAVEQYNTLPSNRAWSTFDGISWSSTQQVGMKVYSPPAFNTFFDIYQSGVPYRFDSAQQIVIPDLEGPHFIYFDNGVLTTTQSFSFEIIEEWVYVANVYWDADNSKAVLVGDERHGLGMDAKTHEYLHNINGTQINSGFALGNFTTVGDGTADADAQVSIANGVIRDEDITHEVTHSATPSDLFEQILDPIAELPIWYRDGASGYWREDAATTAPVSVGVSTIHYNEFTGAVWQKTEAGDGNFVAMWIFATNDIEEPMISMMGQDVYSTLGDAQDQADYNSISFGTLPAQEFKVAYRLIFETDSTYTNAFKSKLVDVRDLRQTLDTAAPAYAGSYHGSLSGLLDQHHPDFAIFVDDPSQFSGAMSPADDDVQKALQSIDPWFRQLRIKEHPVNKKRVTISAADALRTEGTTLSQVVKNLLLKFDGAEIDFSTGQIFEDDGLTSLGIDFTPEVIPVGEWQWYSVTLIPSTVNADNTINGQLVVLAGSASGATKELAVKAPFANGTQLGLVAIQASNPGPGIEDIPQSDIRQLGVGGGSGGGTGDANELLERVKNRLDIGEYDVVTPVVFSSVEEDLTDEPNTTAGYDVANSKYNFELIGEQFTSVQLLDDEFLAEEKDVGDVELVAYWDLDSLDTAATYEISRDGGNEYQAVTMERIGNSDTYFGRHVFSEETTFTEIIENTSHDTDVEMDDVLNLARAQAFTVTNSMTIKKLRVGVSVIGTIQGNVDIKLVRDSGGFPSTDGDDLLFESVAQDISGLAVGDHEIEVDCTVPANAGTYHVVIETDLEYRDNFLTGVNALRVRTNSADSSPDSTKWNGTTWSLGLFGKLDYSITGRPHEVKVRITSGTADVNLDGFALFYDRDDSFSLISEGFDRQVFVFSGDDNINTFDITNFVADPILMNAYEIETGQVHRKGAWTLNGNTVEFPPNTFNQPGETITIEFLQVFKGSMQFDSRNRALLAENGLGSEDPSLDLSQPGRGIRLRSADGTLYEIVIKNGGVGFDIYEITP
jgi:hypothetical protein